MPVTINDLQTLGDVCSTVCYYLTAHLAAVAAGAPSHLPEEVSQIYQLAVALPKPGPDQWGALVRQKAGGAAAAAAAAAPAGGAAHPAKEPGSRKRIKWTSELEQELVKLVEDEAFRGAQLGKEGTRGGAVNWAAVGRHFGMANGTALKGKYHELKGLPLDKPKSASKAKKEGEAADGEKSAKKAKTEAAKEPAAAAAAPATAGEPTPGADWSKKQEEELVKLVESESERKAVLGKKKLRWKKIGEHLGHKSKACRKHYTKLTGKEAPEDED